MPLNWALSSSGAPPSSGAPSSKSMPHLYYLANFRLLLRELHQRYHDLLDEGERGFIDAFHRLPDLSQALMVRMIMRKGELFRASKLRYAEIPDLAAAMAPLAASAWVDPAPVLTLSELFGVLRKAELIERFAVAAHSTVRKAQLYAHLAEHHADARPYATWRVASVAADDAEPETVYRVAAAVRERCEQLRLLYFGNYRQDLSEFVLADLGVFKYEPVELDEHARAFHSRQHIDGFFQLYRCRQALQQWCACKTGDAAPLSAIMGAIPQAFCDSEWLEDRRQRLCFELAREVERCGDVARAVEMYRHCHDARAAPRLRRLTERERLRRARRPRTTIPMIDMTLPLPVPQQRIEHVVRDELTEHNGGAAPVHYVENVLVNALFGLLCWRAIFAPIPGAFFHAYHHGPADLASAHFRSRRGGIFDECLDELEHGTHRDSIVATYRRKKGIASPFVHWGAIDEALLSLALDCIPPVDLRIWFDWILRDVTRNRAGFPDLIQFWPLERRYALVEVKGPGDRLQDNQRRCLEHCLAHRVPVSVVRVQWAHTA